MRSEILPWLFGKAGPGHHHRVFSLQSPRLTGWTRNFDFSVWLNRLLGPGLLDISLIPCDEGGQRAVLIHFTPFLPRSLFRVLLGLLSSIFIRLAVLHFDCNLLWKKTTTKQKMMRLQHAN